MPVNHLNNSHRKVLKDNNITNRKEWKFWLSKNHPDKNPSVNPDLVRKIIEAGKLAYPT